MFFHRVRDNFLSLQEAITAGAMLSVIAETMLPKTYENSVSAVDFAAVFAFLGNIYSKRAP